MKPASLSLVALLLSLSLLSSCDTSFHNSIYDDDEKIASLVDSYVAATSIGSKTADGGYALSATMTGTQTIWSFEAEEDMDIPVSCKLSVTSGGYAKLVLVGPDGDVTTIVENTDNAVPEDMQPYNLSLKKGNNRIKVVGYDSPKLKLEIQAEQGRFGSGA